jgi:hypothetical protein
VPRLRFGAHTRNRPAMLHLPAAAYIHTYHSRFILEGVAETSQILLRDTHVLPTLVSYEEADVTGGKPIAVFLQFISGVSAINPLVAFYDIQEERERCYSFILSRTPHETAAIMYYYRIFITT